MEQMVEARVGGVQTQITQQQLNEYMSNPKFKVICEAGVYRILEKMEG